LGTSLYIRQPLTHRIIGRKFKEIKRFPFKPNSAYAFAVNDCAARQSYHGRELITASQTTRDTILITWNSRNIAQGQKHRSPGCSVAACADEVIAPTPVRGGSISTSEVRALQGGAGIAVAEYAHSLADVQPHPATSLREPQAPSQSRSS